MSLEIAGFSAMKPFLWLHPRHQLLLSLPRRGSQEEV